MSTPLLDNITQQFISTVSHNGHLLEEQAKRIFYYLAVIQLSISGIWMAIAGESLLQSFIQLIKTALLLSVFYAGITLAQEWLPSMVNGFIHLGQQAGATTAIHPSSILNQGLTISGTIIKSLGGLGMLNHPFVSFVGAVVCIGIPLVYALIAADLTIVLIKTYLMISLSSLFFAFGASDWTRTMSVNYIKSLLSLGLQLMSLYFLIGVGVSLGNQWAEIAQQAAAHHELMPMLAIFSAVIVFYLIIRNIPPYVAALSGMSGFRNSGEMAVGMAAFAATKGAKLAAKALKKVGLGGGGSSGKSGMHGMSSASLDAIKKAAMSQQRVNR